MSNIFYLVASGTSSLVYLVLAFWQTVGLTDLTLIKDVGMGGAFIATCFFMFRYFVAQIEAARRENKELTDRFIKVIENYAESTNRFEHQLLELTERIEAKTSKK